MALNIGNLIAVLGMDKKGFDKGIKEADEKTEGFAAGFGEKLSKLKVPIAAVGAAVAAIGTAAILAADDMNKAYNNIRVGSGATGEALEVLKGDFDAVFGTVPADAAAVSVAIADLNTRLDLSGEPLQAMATQFLELSRITGTDVGQNIKEVTRIFGDWQVSAEDQADTLDYLFKTSQSTGITISELGKSMVKSGPALRAMGFDFDTTAALLGKFEKEGVNGEQVARSMGRALSQMATEGVTDTKEAFSLLVDQIANASTASEAALFAVETFGAQAGPELAESIRQGRFAVDDLIDSLRDSDETVLGAAEDAMSLADRMAILKNKSQKALEPVGNLMIGVFETAMPHLEAAGDALVEMGRGVATWAEEVAIAAGPVVEAFQEKMAPVVDFFQGKQEHLVEWWAENSEIFIAAWENVAAAITWVLETVIVPLFEWVWPYIESIYSGVLDTMLGVAKLFAAIIAGDWDAAGDALVDITKGAMAALNGVWAAGWDAIAAGIEFVGQGILDFVYDLFKNILKFIENEINKWIDAVNRAAAAVAGMLGISMGPLIPRISLSVSDIRAPQIKIPRWSETAYGQAIDEFLSSDEEDIDAEFEDADAPEQAPELPKSSLPVVPKPEIPATVTTTVKVPPVDVPDSDVQLPPTPTLPDTQPPAVTAPTIETPVPVTVVNWPDHMPAVPAPEIPVVDEEEEDIDAEFEDMEEEVAEQPSILPASPPLPPRPIPTPKPPVEPSLPMVEVEEVEPLIPDIEPDLPDIELEYIDIVETPFVEIPDINIPVSEQPDIEIPPLEEQEVPVPDIDTTIEVSVEMPDIGAPPTPDEDPSVPTLPTIESPSVTIPDVDTSVSVTVDAPVPISSNIATPIPVTVSNWPSSLEDDDIDAEFDQEGSADQVSVTSEPTPRIGGVDVPIPELPEQEDRTLSISTPEISIPDHPAIEVPTPKTPTIDSSVEVRAEQSSVPMPLSPDVDISVDLEAPEIVERETTLMPSERILVPKIPTILDLTGVVSVLVTNWPERLIARLTQDVEEVYRPDADEGKEEDEDIDAEFEPDRSREPEQPAFRWPVFAPPSIPNAMIPDLAVPTSLTAPDLGCVARALDRIGGETRVVVELDGNVIGETLFRTWNRRTGGALNG